MNKKRSVKKVIHSQKVNMGGHLLEQPLPVEGIDQIDPFLLIHHWEHTFPGGQRQKEVGVGAHPHRGFSPVTFIFKGTVHHRDSFGNDALVNEGGTQWMHAGRGVNHSERPGKELAEHGGESEFIQFWVNTPAKHKMETPFYKPLSDEETPKVVKNNAEIAVVAGELEGVKGVVPTYSPQTLLRVNAKEKANFNFDIPENYNCLIYQLDGKMMINGQQTKAKDMIWFENNGTNIEIETIKETRFIVLSGKPIGEEVTSYGPFVMNTQTEVLEALRDAQKGKMGILIEEF